MRDFKDLLKIVLVSAAVGIIGFGGVFLLLGWTEVATELVLRVCITVGVNVAVYGGAILVYTLVSRLAKRREETEMDEFPHLMVPMMSAYILPVLCLVFFVTIWGIALFGFGAEMEPLFRDFLPGDIKGYTVSFLLSGLTGPFSVIALFYLSSTKVAWSPRALRVDRPLHRTRLIQWREVERIVLKRNKKAPITAATLYTVYGKITISCSWFDYEKDWLPFAMDVCEAATRYHVPTMWKGPAWQGSKQ